MEDIYVEGEQTTYFVPTVKFSVENGICVLEGESYLENTFEFYRPLVAWLKEYTTTLKRPLTFNFGLTYFNTASSKSISDILRILKDYDNAGGLVVVNWYQPEWNEDIKQEVEDFSMEFDLPINILTY